MTTATTNRLGVAHDAAPEVKELYSRAKAAQVSMLSVCLHAGVHHDVVGRWRRAQSSPTLTTLRKIQKALDYFERRAAR